MYLEPEKSTYGRPLIHSQWVKHCLSFYSFSFIFPFVIFSLHSQMKMESINILFTFLSQFLTKNFRKVSSLLLTWHFHVPKKEKNQLPCTVYVPPIHIATSATLWVFSLWKLIHLLSLSFYFQITSLSGPSAYFSTYYNFLF